MNMVADGEGARESKEKLDHSLVMVEMYGCRFNALI
jgi:hypothetical protein